MEDNETDFKFKDFLYLNYNFLESFIAQKYKGFPLFLHKKNFSQNNLILNNTTL